MDGVQCKWEDYNISLQDFQGEVKRDVKIKEEDIPTEIGMYGPSRIFSSEYHSSPYSYNCTRDDSRVDEHIKEENLNVVIVDVVQENERRDETCGKIKEEEILADTSTEGEEESGSQCTPGKTKSGRNVRFSYEENCALVHSIVPVYERILGTLAHRTSLPRKKQLWQSVCDAVNSVRYVKRNVDNCRKRFSDIKRRLKEKLAEESRAAAVTGGYPPPRLEFCSYEEELRQIIPPEVLPVLHVVDTDRPLLQSQPTPPPRRKAPSKQPQPSLEDKEHNAGPSYAVPTWAPPVQPEEEPEDISHTMCEEPAEKSAGQTHEATTEQPAIPQPQHQPPSVASMYLGDFTKLQFEFMHKQTKQFQCITTHLRKLTRATTASQFTRTRQTNTLERIDRRLHDLTQAIREQSSNQLMISNQICAAIASLQQGPNQTLQSTFTTSSQTETPLTFAASATTPPRRSVRSRGRKRRGMTRGSYQEPKGKQNCL
ncbi:myb-related transcription factor, partner of profilin-like isoform X2 [Pseudophryne corroboree]|uniref:myb-related transcription factor, partner of profilin-like isoform X2 n=1 Tax=Pseudophryne corroboree TaxID=495146 RepID=UPI0030814557